MFPFFFSPLSDFFHSSFLLDQLSCDARFAISNMTAEFGGIAGIFEGDDVTAAYLAKRTDPKHKSASKFFRADPDAQYAASYEIDLGGLDSLVALYPSPDNVVTAAQVAGKPLDGCFIGACTTAEEDLILGALVLEQGLKSGLKTVSFFLFFFSSSFLGAQTPKQTK